MAAVAALGLLIAGCSGGPGASGSGASGSGGPRTLPTAADWSRHELTVDMPQVGSLIAGGPGFIAGGSVTGGDAAIWTSTDGLAWTRAGGLTGQGNVNAIITGGPGFVAVGVRANRAAIWTSTDGLTWSAAPDSPDLGASSGLAQMSSVVRGGPGFVAVGVESGGGGSTGQQAAVWTSVDGIAWRRTVVPDPGDWMHDIVAGGPGFVAVGTAQPAGSAQEKAAVWTSVDGTLWSRVADGPVFANGAIGAIVTGPKGLLAVGHTFDPQTGTLHPVTWTSADGLTWATAVAGTERPLSSPPQAYEGSAISDVARVGDGWLAVGTDIQIRPDGALQTVAMWTSSDGSTWTRLADAPIFLGGLSGGLAFGAGPVAVRNNEVIVLARTTGPRTTVLASPPRPGGTVPSALPSAPPATSAPPAAQATPAPMAPTAEEMAAFGSLRCELNADLKGAIGTEAGIRGPDADAFFGALDKKDPKAIASTLPAVRKHLHDAQALLGSSPKWPPSADWLAAEQKLIATLLANLDTVEADAAAGRAPADGSSGFLGDEESVLLLDALKALPSLPDDGGVASPCPGT